MFIWLRKPETPLSQEPVQRLPAAAMQCRLWVAKCGMQVDVAIIRHGASKRMRYCGAEQVEHASPRSKLSGTGQNRDEGIKE